MDPRPAPNRLRTLADDSGFASLQFVLAAGLAMLMVVGLVQLIAYQYTRGALVGALERGVRAGAVTGSGADECRAALADSLAEVLGGAVGETVIVDCSAHPEVVRARAVGVVPAWFAAGPDLAIDVEAIARREPVP